ncbi:MAG TPA: trypsin-like peptidase domain-containing protein [Thermomicrobiaceae bacterium]|nr:trypsin-like peptidase domain-containing protein [Thermomicrobiaceae bacterium]
MHPLSIRATAVRVVGTAILAFLLLVAPACGTTRTATGPSTTTVTVPAAIGPTTATPSGSTTTDTSFADAVMRVSQLVKPAVVEITNEQSQISAFGQAFTVPAGVGSGVIYDTQGHILTNNHVVAGAQQLLVSLPDGRSFTATLVGADPQTDLAVVQIHGDNLPVATLGDSSRLQIGQWVVAIGNALALPGGPTVTAGVVSALDRTVQEPGSSGSQTAGPFLFDMIQTDAPINSGNSGGPLVNLDGQVVGIATLVAGQSTAGVQSQGIGFAIAIGTAKPIAAQLVASGHVDHPYLGVAYTALNPAIAAQLGVSAKNGAVVLQVAAGSPAAHAGVQVHDIITAIDGTPLDTESALAATLNRHKPGDTVTLAILRGSQILTLKATLGQTPTT